MRLALALFVLLALSCSRTKPQISVERVSTSSTSSEPATRAPSEFSIAAEGEPYGLRLQTGILAFCDKRGGRKLDLKSGGDSNFDFVCPKDKETNTSCSGMAFDVAVRAPLSKPNDIVDVAGSSFPLKGRVHDCAYDGKTLAIVTASVVVLIDVKKGAIKEISQEGGDRVTVGSGWVAWTEGSKVRATILK